MEWSGRNFCFQFPRRPLVMGIVNVTPDSFSDGGQYIKVGDAVFHARRLVAEGADILDLGGESSRPGAVAVDLDEELGRVIPVIEELRTDCPVPISIDTRKPEVARRALSAGAAVVNDIEAARYEEAMWRVVADAGAGYLAMHMQGTPDTMQNSPHYEDVVADLDQFFEQCLKRLQCAGVTPTQVALDPGIGFGKTAHQNLRLLAGLRCYRKYNRPVVLGVSRKSFLGTVAGGEPSGRLAAGLACTIWGAQAGVNVFRTHDVLSTVQALKMWSAISDGGLIQP